MTAIEWPVMWVEEDDMPQIGTPDLEWQGKPLTFPTIDEWTISMARDSLATLTVRIPVIVRTRPKVAPSQDEQDAAMGRHLARDYGVAR